MPSFGEILQYFKDNEEAENIVPLVEDEELRKAIVAWKSVEIRYTSSAECGEKNDASKWNWLWKQVDFSQTDFGVVAGVRQQDTGRMVQRLIGLRLIYPDGTISKFAKQYLQMTILSKIRPASKQSSKAEAAKPSEPERKDSEKN